MTQPLSDRLAAHIARHGSVSFATFQEFALYDAEHGFYGGGGGHAGTRTGQFLTSPEVGPLFARVLGRALDAWWHEAGSPEPFMVVEAGAGPGTLAAGIARARPACARALSWILVERSAPQRACHGERLPLADPALALPPVPPDESTPPPAGDGPRFVSLAELPAIGGAHVVLANELLDNLPVRLVERTGDHWSEVRVGLDASRPGSGFVEVLAPLPDDHRLAAEATRWAPGARPGSRLPVQHSATRWLADALTASAGGRVVVLDYARSTQAMAELEMGEWLRTYRDGGRAGAPLEHPGTCDITCDVAIDQLESVAPAVATTQREFLTRWGIEELVEEGRRVWGERAHVGDLAALEARSRIREAEALCDPDGLGGFWVGEWRTAARPDGPRRLGV